MKRFLTYALILTILFSLCSCAILNPSDSNVTQSEKDPTFQSTTPATNESTTPSTEETIPSDPDISDIPEQSMISVSLPVVTMPGKADDGNVIFNYIYQDISLTLNDPEVADKVILDFMNRIDSTSNTANNIFVQAKNEYNDPAQWNPYLCQITYDPMRLDQSVLSLFGCYATFQGSIHPEAQYQSVNYDLITGNTLLLSDILTDETTSDTLYNLVVEVLTAKVDDYSLFSDFEELLKTHFGSNIFRRDEWYLSANGLCFFFQPYDIAPYSSGAVIAEIPYEKLWGILEGDYFPTETTASFGKLYGTLFGNVNPEDFTKFTELVLDDQADNALLYADGLLQNIRIETVEWSASGAYYTVKQTVFASTKLSQGEAILIEAALKDKLPTLRISYEINGKTETHFITKDSNDQIIFTS